MGKVVDKFGCKIMIVIGLFIFSLLELLFGIGEIIELLFVLCILGGVSGVCIMFVVIVFIVDIIILEICLKMLGYMLVVIIIGLIIGLGVGGFLVEIGM